MSRRARTTSCWPASRMLGSSSRSRRRTQSCRLSTVTAPSCACRSCKTTGAGRSLTISSRPDSATMTKHQPERVRCAWATTPLGIEYHDREWGVPVHDDRVFFEFLILEGAQAGLSWETILQKRENY